MMKMDEGAQEQGFGKRADEIVMSRVSVKDKITALSGLWIEAKTKNDMDAVATRLAGQINFFSEKDGSMGPQAKMKFLMEMPGEVAENKVIFETINKAYTRQENFIAQSIKTAYGYTGYKIKGLIFEDVVFETEGVIQKHMNGQKLDPATIPQNISICAANYYDMQIESASRQMEQENGRSPKNKDIIKLLKSIIENAKESKNDMLKLVSKYVNTPEVNLKIVKGLINFSNDNLVPALQKIEQEKYWDASYAQQEGSIMGKALVTLQKHNSTVQLWSAFGISCINPLAGRAAFGMMGLNEMAKGIASGNSRQIVDGAMLVTAIGRIPIASKAATAYVVANAAANMSYQIYGGINTAFTTSDLENLANNGVLLAGFFKSKSEAKKNSPPPEQIKKSQPGFIKQPNNNKTNNNKAKNNEGIKPVTKPEQPGIKKNGQAETKNGELNEVIPRKIEVKPEPKPIEITESEMLKPIEIVESKAPKPMDLQLDAQNATRLKNVLELDLAIKEKLAKEFPTEKAEAQMEMDANGKTAVKTPEGQFGLRKYMEVKLRANLPSDIKTVMNLMISYTCSMFESMLQNEPNSIYKSESIAKIRKLESSLKAMTEEIASNIYREWSEIGLKYADNPLKMEQEMAKTYMKYTAMQTREVLDGEANIHGYKVKIYEDAASLAEKARTFNDILHIVHKLAIDNLPFAIESDPAISARLAKTNVINIGVETPYYKNTMSRLATLDSDAKMYGIQNGMGMTIQVRDYGHATSVTISENAPGVFEVKYQIPKAFEKGNVSFIEGFENYDSKYGSATGSFIVKGGENLPQKILDFFKKVPTDGDYFDPATGTRIKRVW